ncbi:MAG TPA: DUF983 domain-containing protein [Micropepsaceae bacterium]|nr:DUF983 domain-containing protein [Micropepsaceae bacterium]
MNSPVTGAEPSVAYASLLGRCPRCGKGKLFSGFLNIAPACKVCGLDFSNLEAGDGPAVFVILIVGAIVTGGALLTEVWFSPPYWVHAVIWGPAVVILSLGMLRPLKAGLVVLQYRHRAEEGRLRK